MSEKTPITDMERAVIAKISHASYPPATASKRFVKDLSSGYIQQLSDRGRAFLAFIAHRFRRQYELTAAEWAWVNEWRVRFVVVTDYAPAVADVTPSQDCAVEKVSVGTGEEQGTLWTHPSHN